MADSPSQSASIPPPSHSSDAAGASSSLVLAPDGEEHLADQSENLPECAICLQTYVHPVRLPCSHVFCFLCVKGVANHSKRCALCRSEIPASFLSRPALLNADEVLETHAIDGKYQWFYEGIRGWWQYDGRASNEIEDRFQNGERIFEMLIAGFLYIIDMENMIQYRRNTPTRRRRIKRDLINIPDKKGIAGLSCKLQPPKRTVGDGGEKTTDATTAVVVVAPGNASNGNSTTTTSSAVAVVVASGATAATIVSVKTTSDAPTKVNNVRVAKDTKKGRSSKDDEQPGTSLAEQMHDLSVTGVQQFSVRSLGGGEPDRSVIRIQDDEEEEVDNRGLRRSVNAGLDRVDRPPVDVEFNRVCGRKLDLGIDRVDRQPADVAFDRIVRQPVDVGVDRIVRQPVDVGVDRLDKWAVDDGNRVDRQSENRVGRQPFHTRGSSSTSRGVRVERSTRDKGNRIDGLNTNVTGNASRNNQPINNTRGNDRVDVKTVDIAGNRTDRRSNLDAVVENRNVLRSRDVVEYVRDDDDDDDNDSDDDDDVDGGRVVERPAADGSLSLN